MFVYSDMVLENIPHITIYQPICRLPIHVSIYRTIYLVDLSISFDFPLSLSQDDFMTEKPAQKLVRSRSRPAHGHRDPPKQ